MNKKIEWLIIITLVVILIGLSSCSPSSLSTKPTPHQTAEEYQAEITDDMDKADQPGDDSPTVANLQGVANALVCVFAPDTCQEKKDLGETEENKQ